MTHRAALVAVSAVALASACSHEETQLRSHPTVSSGTLRTLARLRPTPRPPIYYLGTRYRSLVLVRVEAEDEFVRSFT